MRGMPQYTDLRPAASAALGLPTSSAGGLTVAPISVAAALLDPAWGTGIAALFFLPGGPERRLGRINLINCASSRRQDVLKAEGAPIGHAAAGE